MVGGAAKTYDMMTTFSLYSFRFIKISLYINFEKFFDRILAPPSGRRPGADAPPRYATGRVLGFPPWSSASGMYATHNIENFEALLRKTLYGFVQRLENSSNKIIASLIKSWTVRFVDWHCWISRLYT